MYGREMEWWNSYLGLLCSLQHAVICLSSVADAQYLLLHSTMVRCSPQHRQSQQTTLCSALYTQVSFIVALPSG